VCIACGWTGKQNKKNRDELESAGAAQIPEWIGGLAGRIPHRSGAADGRRASLGAGSAVWRMRMEEREEYEHAQSSAAEAEKGKE